MASTSVSGRAITSAFPFSDEESKPSSTEESISNSKSDAVFVPHVFDFVSIHNPANFRVSSAIPSLYLEPLAVDQSIIVGHGASFTVFKRAIPAAPQISQTFDMGGWTMTVPRSQKSPPKHVVYKVARVAFTETGTPTSSTRHAMKAALMELYALMHEPLRQHPNIIDLLGLAWGSNYFESSHRLPVLVVEYADHGSLADLQQRHDLMPSTRHHLGLDIGHGLQMLHQCGIIHGDVKSENVLIFSHPERKYIAKLSDFGFSLVKEAADAKVYVGGTRPWKAPEARYPVPNHFLPATDIYSYGLLLWRLASDGHDPFRFWAPISPSLQGDLYLQELERIKEDDHPLKNTALENWFMRYLSTKSKDSQTELSVDLSSLSDPFYKRLSSVLEKCLSVDPSKRDLLQAIAALENDSQADGPNPKTFDTLLHLSYDHHILSWEQMRQLEPAVQSFVFNSFYNKVESLISKNLINCPDCFVLASYYINGYGTKVDYEAAMRLIDLASNKTYDHVSSRTYAYRIHKALDPDYTFTSFAYDNLSVMVLRGSRPALIDLKEVAPAQYAWSQPILRDVMAGVGANFFHSTNMLGGFHHNQWILTFDAPEILVRNLGSLNRVSEYKVNKRGDKILHLAAYAGRVQAIEILLDAFPSMHIDQQNDHGETPLLCACRSGQVATVLRLVELGADASIAATNGETCVHWLLSFGDDDIITIGDALMRQGARLREFTRERVAYSDFHAGIDVDFQLPGSPLTWAIHHDRSSVVKFLLDKAPSGVSVWFDKSSEPSSSPAPLEYAAYFHHFECLGLLMDALDHAKITHNMDSILKSATHAADTFSMILRNGAKYEERLSETLKLCLKRSKQTVFGSGIGEFDTTLLFYAVSECHDKVVECLLSKDVAQLVESFGTQLDEGPSRPGAYVPSDINRPAGEHRRTPVLEAIRWNRKPIVELLIVNGADPKALARNPFNLAEMNWGAFHILATAGNNTNHAELVSYLVLEVGLHLNGYHSNVTENGPKLDSSNTGSTLETPFLVAVQHNAFNLASTFLAFGANPNAVCSNAGLLSLSNPTTVLGHIIAASAQHSIPRLRYLLGRFSQGEIKIDFIVEQDRQLSALHRAAWAHKGVMHRTSAANNSQGAFLERDEYDIIVNQNIIQELLEIWGDAEEINLRSAVHGRTALHLAVEAGNIAGVRMLLEKKANASICDELGLMAVDLAGNMLNGLGGGSDEELVIYAEIISMLLGTQEGKLGSLTL